MARVEAATDVPVPLAEAWEMYFDPGRWSSWVDGFESLVSLHAYPDQGGEIVWRSNPAGRGQVRERVLEHAPRSRHRIAFEDPESSGELETWFAIVPGGDGGTTRVSQAMTYELSGGGPLRGVTDFLFIRSQMRRSLERSLRDFALELGQRA